MIKHAVTLAILASSASASIYDYTFTGSFNASPDTYEITYRVDTSVPPTSVTGNGAFWFPLGIPSLAPILSVHLTISDGTNVFLSQEDTLQPGSIQTAFVNYSGDNNGSDAFQLVATDPSQGVDMISIDLLGDNANTNLGSNALPTDPSQLQINLFNQMRQFTFNDRLGWVQTADITAVPTPATLALAPSTLLLTRRRRPSI